MMRWDAAIFDLDGTLCDSRLDLTNAVNHARRQLGFGPLSAEEVSRYVGDGMTKLLERAFHGQRECVEPARPHFRQHYEAHLVDHTTLYEGVRDGFERLAETSLKMAVLTNKPEHFARLMLEHYGLADHFELVAGPDTFNTRKPDPRGALAIARTLESSAERTVIVGDNHTDLSTAGAAGMQVIFCTYGFGRQDGRPCDFTADSFGEVVRLLLE